MSTRLRIGEAAQRLGLSQDTVREWVRRGFLKARRTPTGQLLFDEADVETACSGNRLANPKEASADQISLDGSKVSEAVAPPWKKLPPWESEVQAARASLALDELAAQRQAKLKARENEERQIALAQQQAVQAEAHRQRLEAIKVRAIRALWISPEYRQKVVEAIEHFATAEKLPPWLSEAEHFDLVVNHAHATLKTLQAEEERRLAEQRAEAQRQVDAEYERHRRKFAGLLTTSRPRSVAEALRERRITEE